jgi:hypothetical protein
VTCHPVDRPQDRTVTLVLGAGNVSSIPVTDALTKLVQDGTAVLLKLNPVNDYLEQVLTHALNPFIQCGALRIIRGGADVGAFAAASPAVDRVHVTGSGAAYDSIVFGPPGDERDRRRAADDPVLAKPVTCELGNVTPLAIVPGDYAPRELESLAQTTAAMIAHNGSFNCVALKVIVTEAGWAQRTAFLDRVEAILASIPPRYAYYPGACERYARFAGLDAPGPDDSGRLPWRLRRAVDPAAEPHCFREESFTCVCVETSLEARSPEAFVDALPEFLNERIAGTLACTIAAPDSFRAAGGNEVRLARAIAALRYGVVAVNHWSALAFLWMCVPWGGHPSGTRSHPGSGRGWVHNLLGLEGVEKSVVYGPSAPSPRPVWHPAHRRPLPLMQGLFRYYERPSWWRLARLLPSVLGG